MSDIKLTLFPEVPEVDASAAVQEAEQAVKEAEAINQKVVGDALNMQQFTPEEQLFFEEDKLYRASIEDNEIIGYTVYEHDADGNLLSHREILADEYTP